MTGARIIDFALARQARVQPPPAPGTARIDCSALLRDLETHMDHLAASVLGMKRDLTGLSDTCAQCREACEVTDIDALERERDRLTAAWRAWYPDGLRLSTDRL